MRRIVVGVLLLAGLIILISSGNGKMNLAGMSVFDRMQGKVFAQIFQKDPYTSKREFERVLTLQERQPIYMKRETFIPIGELEADQPVVLVGEDEAYYEIQLGKMTVFIRKEQATVEKKKLRVFLHTERLAAVKTFRKTAVYENADVQSGIILQLEEGYRYPIVQDEEDWYIVKIGERPGYIHKQSVALDEGLPVLVYHHILPRDEMKTMTSTISLESFEQQMGYLADHKFETLTSQQLYDYLEGRLVVPSKAVLITFDDGLLSSKEYAYPILKQYGFKAPHHIISTRTHRAHGGQLFDAEGPFQYLSAEDLVEMKDVFDFEAHTDNLHALLNNKGMVFEHSKEEIVADLQRNIEQLPVAVSLAYPYGQYNEEFISAAKEIGLLIGYTTVEGYANMKGSNYEVCRYGMTEKKSFEQFVMYVDGDMTWQ
ncbi:polysaccharide deacetylase family protein [Sporosarcina obsidiansis]|uniref:polysaccharide deacetylase family protein n=1 Tax=Sporosarcina obsidiansis TaxID=2660748 RepID=UPI00129B1F3F|nr:polysaccharide deacetylase family protein [Sporosarcina obsidiansis]